MISQQRPSSCPLPGAPARPRNKPRRPILRRRGMTSTPTPPEAPSPPVEGASKLPDLEPCLGQLLHLPTKAEAQAVLTLADAYVLEVPVKSANDILPDVDKVVQKDKSINLSHLRRYARTNNLPRYVADRRRVAAATALRNANSSTNILGAFDINRKNNDAAKPDAESEEEEHLFLLVGLTRLVDLEVIEPVITKHGIKKEILRTRVPMSAPMNPSLAREWSDLYWPTQYRKNTPLGPHPTVVRSATEAIRPHAGYWMGQVIAFAKEGYDKGFGPAVAALVVDSKGPRAPAPVAIAVDARYGLRDSKCKTADNIMNHAVMRAIGQIGRKRMSLAEPPRDSERGSIVLDYPILPTEEKVFAGDILPPGGYLCTGLDMYLTHEPCVMCAQAILHSRFDKVVFRRRMSKTGAATPERPEAEHGGLGYGLFWRPELNWRLLAWEWSDRTPHSDDGMKAQMHA